MRYLLLSLFCLIVASRSFADETPKEDVAPTDVIRVFMDDLGNRDVGEGIDRLFASNKWMSKKPDTIDNLKSKLGGIYALLGDFCGYEYIRSIDFGENYKGFIYLVRFERQPIRFIFIFYRPNGQWQIQNMRYDDDLDDTVVAELKKMP